jgi:hypothetical protein
MGSLRVQDGSETVRVEITGVLSESLVGELKVVWDGWQSSLFWRQFVVDISGLTGYDGEGHALLHQLHQHGVTFGAGTPASLGFLEDISRDSPRLVSSTLVTRRLPERSTSPRPRHRAGLGPIEASARAR